MEEANNIAKAFGFITTPDNKLIDATATEITTVEPEQHEVVTINETADEDYHFARDQLKLLIKSSTSTAIHAADVARQNEHANAFIAAATVMKSAIEANKELMNLSKTRSDILKDHGGGLSTQKITNNNLFVGTTHELIQLMRKSKDGE